MRVFVQGALQVDGLKASVAFTGLRTALSAQIQPLAAEVF